jgi:hypothetical protein
MFLEVENKLEKSGDFIKKSANYIAPALIENINEENGQLKIRLIETNKTYWLEPSSNLLHPCGYWSYIQKENIQNHLIEEFKIDSALKRYEFNAQFLWLDFFKQNESFYPACFNLFTSEQKNNMSKLFFPEVGSSSLSNKKNHLSCSFRYNPRYIWSNLKQLTVDDLTDIYRETGIITIRDDPSSERNNIYSSGLILLPQDLSNEDQVQKFVHYPCISQFSNVSHLNVTCTHREDIKLNIGTKTFISNSYPHLLNGQTFDLIKKEQQLTFKHLFIIMCTSLDLSQSTNDSLFPNPKFPTNKLFNDSLRYYFRQLSNCISLVLPLFYTQEYRLSSDYTKKSLLVQTFIKYSSSSSSSTQIDEFIQEGINEFEISSNGLCKYCNIFNINLQNNNSNDSQTLIIDTDLLDKIEVIQDYSKIITSIKLHAEDKDTNICKQSISLSQSLLDHLPNISNISIKNIKINQIDSSINKCLNLRNIELIQNDLKEFPLNLFKEIEDCSLQQIIIDNNPLTHIPADLFLMQSLRSLVLTRLNITNLPDNWLNDQVYISGIKSIHISQTKLKTLPNDLIIGNYSLESLTFQGVHLILPENESQWSFLMIDLNKFKSLYCPNLFSHDEAKQIFQMIDTDKNNLLDTKEIQKLNAYIFKSFPRLGGTTVGENITSKIFKCLTLTYLDLSFQAIRKISSEIKQLKNLKVLKLKYCVYLETLSSSLGSLKLNELDLTGCLALRTPPLEIQCRGVNSVLAYLNRLTTGSIQCKRTKLMIQGLGGVGKTSLMEALLHKIYQNKSESTPNVTDGISIHDWRIPINATTTAATITKDENNNEQQKEELVFSVFDFAGQTVYYNTHQFFLTNRSIYLLVWNVSIYCWCPFNFR